MAGIDLGNAWGPAVWEEGVWAADVWLDGEAPTPDPTEAKYGFIAMAIRVGLAIALTLFAG